MVMDNRQLIASCDPSVFTIENETGTGDKRTILKFQNLVADQSKGYAYAETGSYLGGSLISHLLDDRCELAVSIDKRPDAQPDERGVRFDYSRSSTSKMIDRLERAVPNTLHEKLITFDCDASDLPKQKRRFDLCFIDGEHTNKAAFSDFINLWRWCKDDCVILFHDMNLISDALCNVETFLDHQGIRWRSLCLPDVIFAVLIGSFTDSAELFASESYDREAFFAAAKSTLWQNIAKNQIALGRV